jgi:hypothetical protein
MANYEHIFLHADLPPSELAGQVADAVKGHLGWTARGDVYVARPARHGGEVGGHIARNIFGASDPELDGVSVLDGYEVVFTISTTNGGARAQLDEATWLFHDISARLPYPAVLTRGMDFLVAAWSPALGLTEFPAGTRVDEEHRHLWTPYAITPAARLDLG